MREVAALFEVSFVRSGCWLNIALRVKRRLGHARYLVIHFSMSGTPCVWRGISRTYRLRVTMINPDMNNANGARVSVRTPD